MELTVIMILLITLAGFIKGFTGFGLSLVLISVMLEMGFSPVELLPILVPLFVVLDIFLYFENKQYISFDYKENFTLHSTTLMTLFLGILLGTVLMRTIDVSYLKLIFSFLILIIIFFLVEKVSLHQMSYPSEKENAFFGASSGILTGMFTLNALPASLYLLYHQYPKDKYMGNLVTFILFSDVLLVAIYLYSKLFTYQGFLISAKFLLLVSLGFFLGIFLRRKVNSKVFKAGVILVLAVTAIKGIVEYFI